MREPMTLAVLMGSTREGRLCEAVTRWVIDEVARTERYRVDVIDPLTLELPVPGGPLYRTYTISSSPSWVEAASQVASRSKARRRSGSSVSPAGGT